METPKNIQETTVTLGDVRIDISDAGVWMDELDSKGEVTSSTALAWEELSEEEYEVYCELCSGEPCYTDDYSFVVACEEPEEICNLPALREVG